jgi:hypothetical protein
MAEPGSFMSTSQASLSVRKPCSDKERCKALARFHGGSWIPGKGGAVSNAVSNRKIDMGTVSGMIEEFKSRPK